MKRFLPYLFVFLLLGAIVILIVTGKKNTNKRFDDRITFRKQDKIPYGTYAAFSNLRYLFPEADIFTNKAEPGYWDSLSVYDSGQALIIITPYFLADDYEMKKLMTFVESGNDIFISARNISEDVENALNCKTSVFGADEFFNQNEKGSEDSLVMTLFAPPYSQHSRYSYPGINFNAWAYEIDTTITEKLGGDDLNRGNFIHLKAGRGNLYLHLAPMTFSNYFLLHRNNMQYYEKVFSVISPHVKKIAWDEYYLKKTSSSGNENESSGGWLRILLRYPAFKAAFLTALFVLLIFVLMEMRRKQRIIPLIPKTRNDSLEFVKTIGRLYHDKGDHKNLCRKMASYFQEHIRTKYKIMTSQMDDLFIENLFLKSGYPQAEINKIASFIKNLEDRNNINDQQLITFYKKFPIVYER